MRTHATPKPCRICGEPVNPRYGLATRVHRACRNRETAQRHPRPERPALPPYRLTREVSQGGQTRPAQQKQPPHRDRKLLDLAHEMHECMACGRYVEAGCEPAHSNQARHGKGARIKASDVFFAALCPACHRDLDQGSKLSKQERQDLWQAAHDKTLLEIFRRGWLRVVA